MKNEPAFPVVRVEGEQYCGMTLRDYFAVKAMASLIAKLPLMDKEGEYSQKYSSGQIIEVRRGIAQSAYDYADAMIAEREK